MDEIWLKVDFLKIFFTTIEFRCEWTSTIGGNLSYLGDTYEVIRLMSNLVKYQEPSYSIFVQ
jgi:hypothetical protein